MNVSNNRVTKNTSILTLRIIAMFWIVMFHFSDHGIVDMTVATFNASWGILAFARLGGGVGNCIFVLISGYLLYNKQFKVSRILKLWLAILFYSVAIGVVCYGLDIVDFSLSSMIKMFIPIISQEYWYMSTYVVLYLLYPFIVALVEKLTKRQLQYLLGVLLVCFSVIPTGTKNYWLTGTGNIPIFVTLFLLGAYIRKFHIIGFTKNHLNLVSFMGIGILIWLSECLLKCLGFENPFYFSWEMYKFPIIIMALFMFFTFINTDLKVTPIMYRASESVFGVYLIHMGRLGDFIFREIINNEIYYDKPIGMVLYLFGCSIVIFFVCVFIDQLRIKFIENKLLIKLESVMNWLDMQCKIFIP